MTIQSAVTSGVDRLDKFLGGFCPGDNVVFHDQAGSLAHVFLDNLIEAARQENFPVVFLTVDRSPQSLLERWADLAQYEKLTLVDGYTWGKGAGSDTYTRFYRIRSSEAKCRVVPLESPSESSAVLAACLEELDRAGANARFICDGLSGLKEIWQDTEAATDFYQEIQKVTINTQGLAYWVVAAETFADNELTDISQCAQVELQLGIKRGTSSLAVLKAEGRQVEAGADQPVKYWNRGTNVTFDGEKKSHCTLQLGARLKELRVRKGLSQTELARLVGVTPSTISQVENNLIYPSLPALMKMAEVLNVDMSSFFSDPDDRKHRHVFPGDCAVEVQLGDIPRDTVMAKLLTPVDYECRAEPYLLEILPGRSLQSHFFDYKGEEAGYLIRGRLEMKMKRETYTLDAGDYLCLTSETPVAWRNPGPEPATILWLKIA